MILKEIDSQEFDLLAISHPLAFFQQTSAWAKVKSYTDWIAYYVKMEDDNGKLVALSMILGKRLPIIGKYMFYCPRGYLVDYHDYEVLKAFTNEIKKFAKQKKAIFLKIDPYVPYKEHDSLGNLVEGGFDNSDCVRNLQKLGYKHNGFNLFYENIQPRWLMVVDTKDKDYSDIESNYDSNVRRVLNKCARSGVKIRELDRQELDIFSKLMSLTAKRRDFENRPLEYYQNMYDAFSDRGWMKIMVAEIDFKDAINRIDVELKTTNERKSDLLERTNDLTNPKVQKKINEYDSLIESLNNRREKITKDLETYGNNAPASSFMFITYGSEILFLIGGSDERLMDYSASHLLYRYGLEYACMNKKRRFNMYGITGYFNNKSEHYGVYDIKRRFGGKVLELIGQFTLVISPFWNFAYNFAVKARNFIKGLR